MEHAGKIISEQFDTVISAVGIVGNIEGLGLEKMSIETENSHIITDRNCNVGIEAVSYTHLTLPTICSV